MKWQSQVSDFLTKLNIPHECCEQGIMINRDGIIQAMHTLSENDAYDILKVRLKDVFGLRFLYGAKTDEWLLLQTIKDLTTH